MANETLQNPFLPEDENQRAYDVSDLMLGGAGLGGAAFAAQTGRAPTPVPPKTPPVPFPSGKNIPTNPLSPATGPSGGTGLPPQPTVSTASQAAQQTQAELARRGGLFSNLKYQGQQGLKSLDAFGQKASGFIDESSRALAPYADELIGNSKALVVPAFRALGQVVSYGGGQFVDPVLQGAAQYAQMLSPDPVVKTRPRGEPITDASELEGLFYRNVSPAEAESIEIAKQLKQQAETPKEPFIQIGPSGKRILDFVKDLEGKMAEFQRGVSEPPAAVSEYQALGTDVPALGGEAPTEPLTSTPEAMGDQETPVAPSLPSDVQPGSPQAKFLEDQARLAEAGQELSPAQIAQAEEFARSMGTTFDPETGYSREPFLSAQASRTGTPMPGQTLSQFMRYEDQPEQRTEQFVDPQGRIRRRMTPTAAALAGLPAGVQPLSPEYTPFEQAGAMREARLAAQPDFGRAISDRERRGGQLSQADLRDLVQAERPGATVGEQARALEIQQRAGMGEFEAKSPEEEELERQSKQARIDFMKAQIAQMEKEPTEAEKKAADVELRLKEQKLRQGGFEPVGVETDPDTGISVQLYRNPQTGEEQRVYKTASGTPVSDDDLQSLFGDSAKVNEAQTSIPTITSQEEYDNLEKGARYRDSQGRLATKKS